MPRHHRLDHPGAAHHVFNRGIARRSVFETEADVRYALSLFAREVRAGRLRLVSYSFLTTHFHALVEAPNGDLSASMQRITNLYVRRFNRERKRDGPLFRGRFGSRLVDSDTYRNALVRYIDQNAPQARMITSSVLYPFGSAFHYVAARRPLWLETTWIDGELGPITPLERPDRYATQFGTPLTDAERELVSERMRGPVGTEDPLDDLVGAAPAKVREWMERKARLADGTSPGQACAGREVVRARSRALAILHGDWIIEKRTGRHHDAWQVLTVGLLRDLAALSHADVAALLAIPRRTAMYLHGLHREWMTTIAEYATRVVQVAAACLADLRPASRGNE